LPRREALARRCLLDLLAVFVGSGEEEYVIATSRSLGPQDDHTHGIDDLRSLFIKQRRRLDIYMDVHTTKVMRERFGYCFRSPTGSEYPPIATEHPMKAGNAINVTGQGGTITALPLLQEHGDIPSHAFRFGKFAYSCDLSGMPPETAEALKDLEVWVVDALRYRPHPSHFSLADALSWIERLKPRAILISMA
jgi:phosphoribosyl 1,2-cyclic phosphate phosphodiesterase